MTMEICFENVIQLSRFFRIQRKKMSQSKRKNITRTEFSTKSTQKTYIAEH